MENIVLGFVLGATVIGFIALLMMTIRMSFIISEMSTILKSVYVSTNKLEQITQATMNAAENFVDALNEVANDTNHTTLPPNVMLKMFSSEDGKYTAPSFDALIDKMKKDPTYQQMSEKDIEEIKKLFEDNSKDDEDDNDDEPKEPWK